MKVLGCTSLSGLYPGTIPFRLGHHLLLDISYHFLRLAANRPDPFLKQLGSLLALQGGVEKKGMSDGLTSLCESASNITRNGVFNIKSKQ